MLSNHVGDENLFTYMDKLDLTKSKRGSRGERSAEPKSVLLLR